MSEIKEINKIEEISDNFFFYEGQKEFNELVEFANKNNNILTTAWEEFQNYNSSISDWIKTNKDKKGKENIIALLNAINKFVSYCDVNALSTDSEDKPFQKDSKKAIAKAFVFQYNWVRNIIKYLIKESGGNIQDKNGKNIDNNKIEISYSVQKAIAYFKEPNKIFNILSKEHRKKISLFYLDEELKESFDENLLNTLKGRSGFEKCNETWEYTNMIYEKAERSQWDCKVDTTLLEKNYNLILTGAPGTGKTYLARQMAKKLTNENDNNIGFVQFHPSYDYTDFVEGLRPHEKDGNIVFKRENGVFKEFCKKAIENKKNKYVFIIDEINRGEISKIFGELFFSIDPGYREKEDQDNTNKVIKVKTQYQNMITEDEDPFKDGFYVPENVYIIGTMNDIDRSVESMDFAFRRRFAFHEITAEESMERILYDLDDNIYGKAVDRMKAINDTLDELGLNSNYHIGAAYFMKALNYLGKSGKATENTWDQLWKLHLKGTLFEYFRGEPDANENLKQLEKAYYNAK